MNISIIYNCKIYNICCWQVYTKLATNMFCLQLINTELDLHVIRIKTKHFGFFIPKNKLVQCFHSVPSSSLSIYVHLWIVTSCYVGEHFQHIETPFFFSLGHISNLS